MWKIGRARQRLSQLLRRAEKERQRAPLAQALAEARRICIEERYTLEFEPRVDRRIKPG